MPPPPQTWRESWWATCVAASYHRRYQYGVAHGAVLLDAAQRRYPDGVGAVTPTWCCAATALATTMLRRRPLDCNQNRRMAVRLRTPWSDVRDRALDLVRLLDGDVWPGAEFLSHVRADWVMASGAILALAVGERVLLRWLPAAVDVLVMRCFDAAYTDAQRTASMHLLTLLVFSLQQPRDDFWSHCYNLGPASSAAEPGPLPEFAAVGPLQFRDNPRYRPGTVAKHPLMTPIPNGLGVTYVANHGGAMVVRPGIADALAKLDTASLVAIQPTPTAPSSPSGLRQRPALPPSTARYRGTYGAVGPSALDEQTVVKTMETDCVSLAEVATLARLRHPCVVAATEFCVDALDTCIAMPRWAGNLSDLAGWRWTAAAELVPWMLRDIAGALAHMHGLGLAHLDVRPHNILCDAAAFCRQWGPGQVWPRFALCDFGMTHPMMAVDHADAALRGRWSDRMLWFGTLYDVSPEVALRCEILNLAAIDVWALGSAAFLALVGSVAMPAACTSHAAALIFVRDPHWVGARQRWADLGAVPARSAFVERLRDHQWGPECTWDCVELPRCSQHATPRDCAAAISTHEDRMARSQPRCWPTWRDDLATNPHPCAPLAASMAHTCPWMRPSAAEVCDAAQAAAAAAAVVQSVVDGVAQSVVQSVAQSV
jgi:hypothetical protein